MKLKVLPNPHQKSLDGRWLRMKLGDSYDEDSDKLLDPIIGWDTKRFEPVYNRVGWYKTKEMSWYEWKLPSGRMVATLCNKDHFEYTLSTTKAKENPIGEVEWGMIQHLNLKGILKWSEEYQFESLRRYGREQEIRMKRSLLQMRKRIAEKKREVENART